MKKYRIIESYDKGYYHVQEWVPGKWWGKGHWSTYQPYLKYTLQRANDLLDWILKEEKFAKAQAEYRKQPRVVVREEKIE